MVGGREGGWESQISTATRRPWVARISQHVSVGAMTLPCSERQQTSFKTGSVQPQEEYLRKNRLRASAVRTCSRQ
jgi:hypothetical protein